MRKLLALAAGRDCRSVTSSARLKKGKIRLPNIFRKCLKFDCLLLQPENLNSNLHNIWKEVILFEALLFKEIYDLNACERKFQTNQNDKTLIFRYCAKDTFILKVVIHTIFTKRDHYRQQSGELRRVFHRNTERSNINSAFSLRCENSEQLRSGFKQSGTYHPVPYSHPEYLS